MREHAPAPGHDCLARLVQGTVCKILDAHAVKPHKVRYYLESRDPEFETKMAEMLCVCREAAILKQAEATTDDGAAKVAIVSYVEKPGVQAIGTPAPEPPPQADVHASFTRDHEYKRHGTLSLLAGIDLVTGKVHALAKDRHRSREFIEFLELLDAAYATQTIIKAILDNHSAQVSKETQDVARRPARGTLRIRPYPEARLLTQPDRGLFSKLARSVLRHIRVASKQELEDRIIAATDDFNQHPVVHTSSYKLSTTA